MQTIQIHPFLRGAAALLASTLVLCGCTESIDSRQTKVENGLIYKRNADDPFSGTIKNFPRLAFYMSGCDEPAEVPVKDGLLDGKITCTTDGKKSAELGFKEGKKQGEWRAFDAAGKVYIQIEWDNDQKDGVEKIYRPHGIRPADPVIDLVWKDGKKTGTVIDADSYTVRRYRDGLREGEQLEYSISAATLYLYKRINYVHGEQQGVTRTFDPDGKQIKEEIYENGNRVSTKDVTALKLGSEGEPHVQTTIPECVNAKIDAAHREQGANAMIGSDVVSEFEVSCTADLIMK